MTLWFLAQCTFILAWVLAPPDRRFSIWLALLPTWIALGLIVAFFYFITVAR